MSATAEVVNAKIRALKKKRPNLLSRKPIVKKRTDSDMRWLWAAYQMGAFHDVMPADLPRKAFTARMLELMAMVDHVWMLEARGKEGNRPVGVIFGKSFGGERRFLSRARDLTGRGVEPFVVWFPWASTRNQLEATASFLKFVSRELKVFVFAELAYAKFYDVLIRRGFIRRGCKIIDYFSPDEHAILYYTDGPD